jgi:hypothetical protein
LHLIYINTGCISLKFSTPFYFTTSSCYPYRYVFNIYTLKVSSIIVKKPQTLRYFLHPLQTCQYVLCKILGCIYYTSFQKSTLTPTTFFFLYYQNCQNFNIFIKSKTLLNYLKFSISFFKNILYFV